MRINLGHEYFCLGQEECFQFFDRYGLDHARERAKLLNFHQRNGKPVFVEAYMLLPGVLQELGKRKQLTIDEKNVDEILRFSAVE